MYVKSDEDDSARQQYAVRIPPTLIERPLAPLPKLRVGGIHKAIIASNFRTPRVLDPGTRSPVQHHSLFDDVPAKHRTAAIGRAIARIHNKAVPPEMCMTARQVALDALPFGPSKRSLAAAEIHAHAARGHTRPQYTHLPHAHGHASCGSTCYVRGAR